jgi:hypothetical protein
MDCVLELSNDPFGWYALLFVDVQGKHYMCVLIVEKRMGVGVPIYLAND